MSKSDEWMQPDRLAQSAESERGNLSAHGDFGCYARVNSTGSLADSGIESHNLVFADGRGALYKQMWRGLRLNAIADIGCGLGLTSAALARQFPAASVYGYELSPDAIEFARRSFPQVTFECRVINKDCALERRLDLILCQEFYPFTRTADLVLQIDVLRGLRNNLADGGCIIVELSERDYDTSILVNLENITGFALERRVMPYDRVFRSLPILPLARLASFFMRLATRQPRNIHLKFTPLKGH
ncbi:class I SAM-dependent methyltransferase [Magnetospirillum sulfuroxidans]|uniref:Class I SAM-dependent methyltransferase n=1 Tax=Magnetospirillum sulfuroxidans TaxID=611300 RepID=A0ABS5IBT6_9PROT|nr:class I SAM-dependent methyltransferase [Magnetospirillum sulfuroxidans]MBR9971887.1 class I SAM-dependent methyltransferase [Magnetospirillum sulfuroxidans]